MSHDFQRLRVDLFGHRVDYVGRRSTCRMLEFYLRPHVLAEPGPPASLQVGLMNSHRCSFQRALTYNGIEKRVYLNEGAGWHLYDRFFVNGSRPSLIPPIGLDVFRAGYRTVHAAAAQLPGSGCAVVIYGESGSGKSSLLLGLLTRGAGFLADDVTVVRRADRVIMPYGRPIGVRETAWRQLEDDWPDGLAAAKPFGRTVSTTSGPTTMIRSEDLGFVQASPTPIGFEIRLHRSESLTVDWVSSTQLRIGWLPSAHLTSVGTLVATLGGKP